MVLQLRERVEPGDYRSPPVNYEAEQALLGAILANNAAFEKVSDFLIPDHFAHATHGRIFAACGQLIERGQIADAVTLKGYFERDETLSEVGGAQYLAQLIAAVPSIINAVDYGKVIHDLYLRRQLIALGEDMVNDAFDVELEQDANDQIEACEEQLYRLAEEGQTEGGFQEFKVALTTALDMAQAAFKRDGGLSGVATEFADLDKLLGGMHASDLIILAGRPSMGKTALATNIAFNAGRKHIESKGKDGAVVGFFSLEMSAEQLATRLLAEESRVPSEKIRRGEMSNDDFGAIVQASHKLERVPLFIDDTPAISVSQLRTRARRLKRQKGLSMIVVDYLQLMRPTAGRTTENRVQEISDITRGLKAIAKELNVPVIALSQLSRAVEQRDDKRPQLADLRESGSIEQDADVVMFVFREQYYLERSQPGQKADESEEKFHQRFQAWQERCEKVYGMAEVIIGKQRHGPTGTVRLAFEGATTKFSNYVDPEHLPDGPY